jgi:hypothetical protein
MEMDGKFILHGAYLCIMCFAREIGGFDLRCHHESGTCDCQKRNDRLLLDGQEWKEEFQNKLKNGQIKRWRKST